jgi:predicted methyltransferase
MTVRSVESTAIHLLVLVIALCLAACTSPPSLSSRLAHGERSAEDKMRDSVRRPAEVVAFLGVEEGMTVIDLLAAGGYYSDVLAEAVGPNGKVYAHNIEFLLKVRDGVNDKAMTARLAGGRLPNVERLDREVDDLGLEPGSIDLAITALNFHDIYHGRGPEVTAGFLKAVHTILTSDGILGIIDHAGDSGVDNESLHRIEESIVVDAVEAAGFVLEESGEVLRNPGDDRTKSVFAKGLRGATDRFVLRFRKVATSLGSGS